MRARHLGQPPRLDELDYLIRYSVASYREHPSAFDRERLLIDLRLVTGPASVPCRQAAALLASGRDEEALAIMDALIARGPEV